MKPSDFIAYAKASDSCNAWNSSVFMKAEHERIFHNALVISKREGDTWGLSKETYELHRKKDGNFSDSESRYADEVLPYMASAESAASFSHGAKKAYEEFNNVRKA